MGGVKMIVQYINPLVNGRGQSQDEYNTASIQLVYIANILVSSENSAEVQKDLIPLVNFMGANRYFRVDVSDELVTVSQLYPDKKNTRHIILSAKPEMLG